MTVLRQAYVLVVPDMDKFDPELKKRLRRIDASGEGRRVGSTFGSGFGGALKSLGVVAAGALAGVGTAALAAAGGAAIFGLKTAASLEQAQIGFETLLGSGKKATQFLGGLKKFAASTPFELPGLIESSRTLLGVGLSSKQVIPTLKAFGDAAGAVGVGQENFQRIMLATSQAISAGKFQTEDLNQIMENGLPIWTILSRAMGKPVPELRKMASEGKLLSKDVLPLLQKQMGQDYGGAMARQSQTLAGVWSTLKDTVAIGLADAIQPLVPILAGLLPKGAELLGRALKVVSGQFAGFVAGLANGKGPIDGFSGAANTLGLGIRALVAAFQEGGVTSDGFVGKMERIGVAARGAFDFFRAEVLPRLKEFAGFIRSDVIPAVGNVVGWFRQHETVTKTLVVAMGALLVVTKAHAAVIAVQAAGGLLKFISGIRIVAALTKVWAAVQWLLNIAMNANPIGLVVLALAALVAAVVIAYKNSETFRAIVQAAWQGIQAAVSFAWNNVIKPVVTALVWFFQNVIAPAAMWLWNNIFKPVWAGISFAVKAAWVVIQIALAAFRLYLNNVIIPIVRFLWANVIKPVFQAIGTFIGFTWNNVIKPIFNALKAAFNAVGSAIGWVWNNVIKPVFTTLGSFIKDKVAPAFSKGVDVIKSAWDKVKEAAAAPVRFIANTVINKGIIGGINWIAGKVGVKDRIPELHLGFAHGGRLPGAPSMRDNMLAMGPNGPVGLASGEFVVNARQTAKNLPLLQAINSGEGYAGGGLVGLLKGPAKWLSDRLGIGRIAEKFGNNPMTKMVTGAAGRLKDLALGKIKSLIGELFGGGGGVGAGGLRAGIANVLASLRSVFGRVPLISGLRRGATTLSGRRSLHADGRAVDLPPVLAWAQYLNGTFGGRLKELITPWNDLNILNGRSHRYSGAVWNQHNFPGGNAHIHAAMDNGGYLQPGWNGPIYNGTGRPEPVTTAASMDQLATLLAGVREDLADLVAAVYAVPPGVGQEINGVGAGLRRLSRSHA